MAREYVCLNDRNNNDGLIGVSLNTFEQIATLCVGELENVRMAGTGRLSSNCVCRVEENTIIININVCIKAGTNVNVCSREIQRYISDFVAKMTGFTKVTVNVNVTGFYLVD